MPTVREVIEDLMTLDLDSQVISKTWTREDFLDDDDEPYIEPLWNLFANSEVALGSWDDQSQYFGDEMYSFANDHLQGMIDKLTAPEG